MAKKEDSFAAKVWFGAALIAASAGVYYIHYLLFHDIHHIFLYLVGDIAFVFIEVLLVTVIIHQLLSQREKKALLRKMNMVIGAFFSEVGTELLRRFRDFDVEMDKFEQHLHVGSEWGDEHFDKITEILKGRKYQLVPQQGDIAGLRDMLAGKREFLIRLLETPNLLELERFTELLWAVFHLAEQLTARKQVADLPDTDLKHLAGDIKRAYNLLVLQWINYMEHLKNQYPYLFSLAVRTNPFDRQANVEVQN